MNITKKFAVFAWEQTGNDGAAITPQKFFLTLEEAADFLLLWKEAEKWVLDGVEIPNPFPHRDAEETWEAFQPRQEAAQAIADAAAGRFAPFIRWSYETNPRYRSEYAQARIKEPVSHIAEVWV